VAAVLTPTSSELAVDSHTVVCGSAAGTGGVGTLRPMELLDVVCPRCGGEVRERFYGPCETCRSALRAAVAGEARHVDVANYTPKMNVVPNQVATKE